MPLRRPPTTVPTTPLQRHLPTLHAVTPRPAPRPNLATHTPFSTAPHRNGNPFFALPALANARETTHFQQRSRLPRKEHSTRLKAIEEGEILPYARKEEVGGGAAVSAAAAALADGTGRAVDAHGEQAGEVGTKAADGWKSQITDLGALDETAFRARVQAELNGLRGRVEEREVDSLERRVAELTRENEVLRGGQGQAENGRRGGARGHGGGEVTPGGLHGRWTNTSLWVCNIALTGALLYLAGLKWWGGETVGGRSEVNRRKEDERRAKARDMVREKAAVRAPVAVPEAVAAPVVVEEVIRKKPVIEKQPSKSWWSGLFWSQG